MTDSPSAFPHPALRATFSLKKGRGGPSPLGRRWTRDSAFWKDARPFGRAMARPDEGRGYLTSPSRTLDHATSAQRIRPALIATVLTLAAFGSACVPETKTETSPDCVARINMAALQAMKRTKPLGQIQISSLPAAFGPHLLRVDVRVFGGPTEVYAVDVTIDDACNILGVSTRLVTSELNIR
jgi:hypothetical protein